MKREQFSLRHQSVLCLIELMHDVCTLYINAGVDHTRVNTWSYPCDLVPWEHDSGK